MATDPQPRTFSRPNPPASQHSPRPLEELRPVRNGIDRTISSYTINVRSSSLAVGIFTIVATWTLLLLYDFLFLDYSHATPGNYGLLRLLIPLAGLIPMALRLLRPVDLDTDQEAYKLYVRFTIALLITVGAITIASQLVPSSPDNEHSLWWLLTTRGVGLIGYIALPVLADMLVRLYRYRPKLSAPVLAPVYSIGLIALTVTIGLMPWLFSDPQLAISITYTVGGLLSIVALILSGRSSWIINLKKGQKLKLVGLSFLGLITASALLALAIAADTESFDALYAFFPGLPTIGFAIGVSMIMTQSTTFFNALLSLPTADAIDRRNTEVSSLANFARLLTQSFDIDDLTDTAIAIACDVTASAAAWIELGEGTSREVFYGHSPRLPANIAKKLMESRVDSKNVLGESARRKRRVEVVGRITGARWGTGGEGFRELRSVAASPLESGGEVIGTLYVAKEQFDGFDREHLMILGVIADQIALAFEQSRLIRSSFERERFEQEMLIARDLQQRLLPKLMPASVYHEIHAESEPASIVGGDYYDTIAFSDHTVGVIIADVSGKGASAALYMGMVKGIVQALSGTCATPHELLTKANLSLFGNIDNRWFVTMTCAQIIADRRTLRIARAGHCPTLLIRSGEAYYSKPRGIGLAIAKPKLFDHNLELEEIDFSPGDYVIFFSDGLPEARSADGEEFGYERLLEVARSAALGNPSARAMRDAIFSEISTFTSDAPPADDSTIVVVRWG